MTENISPAGARIVAPTRWPASEKIVMLCAPGCIANAEIIYSQALPCDANQFALGVHLQNPPAGWPVKAPDAAPFGT